MSHWNYRLIRYPAAEGEWEVEGAEYRYEVHEIYYDEDGNPAVWTTEPIRIMGNNIKEIKNTLNMIKKDIKHEIYEEYRERPRSKVKLRKVE